MSDNKITYEKIKNYQDFININHPLIDHLLEEDLYVFIGAGASMGYYMPSWERFASLYLDYVLRNTNVGKSISYRTRENVQKLDIKDKLSFCEELIKKEEQQKRMFLKKTFYCDDEIMSGVYEYIWQLNAVYLTTNYDNLLDKYIGRRSNKMELTKSISKTKSKSEHNIYIYDDIIEPGQKLPANLRKKDIVHLHGSVLKKDFNKFVISKEDYIKRYYKNREERYDRFLKEIFRQKTVVFIGYGLKEIEILQYLFYDTKLKDNNETRYVLMGCYPDDYEYVQIYQQILEKYNINILPYDMTDNGYNELENYLRLLCKLIGDEVEIKKQILNEIYSGGDVLE